MNNKFIIITTAYNVYPWIKQNITQIQFQNYKNYIHLIIDDKSTDDIKEINLKNNPNQIIITTPKNRGKSQGDSFMYGIEYLEKNSLIKDEDIIIEVDGDDWLSSIFTLDYLNQIYQNYNIWMTYGQYQLYPSGELGGHYNWEISNDIDLNNNYRENPFPYSHLKTYKYWLFNKINRKDLIDPLTNKIWSAAWDHALCLPMVEMAGKNHIYMCKDILYILNRADELQNEGKTRIKEQKNIEYRIRQLPKYNRL